MKAGRTGYRAGMDVRSVAVPVAAALVSALLAGCGSGDETIASSTADTLHSQVQAVREAVAEGRNGAAESAAANLREDIRELANAGEIDADDALVLLTQVDRIAAELETRATPTPKPTPKPTPAPVPVTNSGGGDGDDGDDEGNGKAKGNGKGKGKDK